MQKNLGDTSYVIERFYSKSNAARGSATVSNTVVHQFVAQEQLIRSCVNDSCPLASPVLHENSTQSFSTQYNIVTSDRLASAASVISKAFAPDSILARDSVQNNFRYGGTEVLLWVNPVNVVPEVFSTFPDWERNIRNNRETHYLSIVGHPKPGVALSQAQSDINPIVARLHQQYPVTTGHNASYS
jgi:hypothetical protein